MYDDDDDPYANQAFMQSFQLYRQQQQQQNPGQQVNYFEQMANFRRELIRQRNEFTERALKQHVPNWFLLLHAGLSLALGTTLIALEVVGLTTLTVTHYSYSGFWCGAFLVLQGLLTLLLCAHKTYCSFTMTYKFNAIAMSVGLIGLVMNLTSVYLPKNTWLTFLILSLEFVGLAVSLVFLIALQCFMRKGGSIQQQMFQRPNEQPNNNNNPIQPSNIK